MLMQMGLDYFGARFAAGEPLPSECAPLNGDLHPVLRHEVVVQPTVDFVGQKRNQNRPSKVRHHQRHSANEFLEPLQCRMHLNAIYAGVKS